jgi:hypothetical protein
LVGFGLVDKKPNKPKATDCGQDFVPFPKTSLEILCLFLFKTSEIIFQNPKQIFLDVKATAFLYSIRKCLFEHAVNC